MLDAPGEAAQVSVVSGVTGGGETVRHDLCVTPCVSDLRPGPRTLFFTSTANDGRRERVDLYLGADPLVVRHVIEQRQPGSSAGTWLGVIGGLGLFAGGLTALLGGIYAADRSSASSGRTTELAGFGTMALAEVIVGIRTAIDAGFRRVKLDTVVLRGINDDELGDIVAFGRSVGAEVRFIEYMDVGGATRWSPSAVVSRAEILASISRRHGALEPIGERGPDTAERFRLSDGTVLGIIASATAPFCGSCDRSRLTADGRWYTCLYARSGVDLRGLLRRGGSLEEIADTVARTWRAREHRGAEDRFGRADRGPILPVEALRRDPHLEIHTRGG